MSPHPGCPLTDPDVPSHPDVPSQTQMSRHTPEVPSHPQMSRHTPRCPLTPPDVPVVVWASGSIPGSGRSHGGGNGNPLQHSCLENPVATRAWWGTVHEVTNSQTRLSRHSELSTLSELWSEMILPAQCHILLFSFPFFCSFIFLLLLLYPSFPCRQIGQ